MTHTRSAMRENRIGLWVALGLVVAGVLLLLDSLNVFWGRRGTVGAILFAVGGAVFLGVFARDRRQWWAAIPGGALVGLALASLLGPEAGRWSPLAFLGSIGLGFGLVYLSDREQWWSLIPAGALLSVGAISALPGRGRGGVLFLGLAVTFAGVAVAPTPHGRQTWAWFPATGLAAGGVFLLTGAERAARFLGPVALIVVGLAIVVSQLVRRCR